MWIGAFRHAWTHLPCAIAADMRPRENFLMLARWTRQSRIAPWAARRPRVVAAALITQACARRLKRGGYVRGRPQCDRDG